MKPRLDRTSLFPAILLLPFTFSAAQDNPTPKTRAFEFVYSAEVRGIPAYSKRLDLWLPHPISDQNQEISGIEVASPYPTSVSKESEYGNSILHLGVDNPKDTNLAVTMKFTVRRKECLRKGLNGAGDGNGKHGDEASMKRFLSPDRLVPIDAKTKSWAAEIVNGKESDLDKARSIYDYSVSNLKYDKSGAGWGQGDLMFACDVKRGNCTDFHAVFIGFSRAVGVPAKFEIGFPIPEARGEGEVKGYHCWAEFYRDGHGWVPVDCSEASRNPAMKDYFFGGLDENRVQFTLGRDIRLNPPQKGERLNFFIYPYAEVDGQPHKSIERKLTYKDIQP